MYVLYYWKKLHAFTSTNLKRWHTIQQQTMGWAVMATAMVITEAAKVSTTATSKAWDIDSALHVAWEYNDADGDDDEIKACCGTTTTNHEATATEEMTMMTPTAPVQGKCFLSCAFFLRASENVGCCLFRGACSCLCHRHFSYFCLSLVPCWLTCHLIVDCWRTRHSQWRIRKTSAAVIRSRICRFLERLWWYHQLFATSSSMISFSSVREQELAQ